MKEENITLKIAESIKIRKNMNRGKFFPASKFNWDLIKNFFVLFSIRSPFTIRREWTRNICRKYCLGENNKKKKTFNFVL